MEKAILIKKGNELRNVFNELSIQLSEIQPDNIQQRKMKMVFKKELFYDIKPSERIPTFVDVTFKFKEDNYGERDIPVSLPSQFFVKYNDLNIHTLPLIDEKDLIEIRNYAENVEDYWLCSKITSVIKKS